MWVANVQQTADCHTVGEFLEYMDVDEMGFCPYMQTFLPMDFEIGIALARRDMYLIGMFYCRDGVSEDSMLVLQRFAAFAKHVSESMHQDGRSDYAPDLGGFFDEFGQVRERYDNDHSQ